MYGPLVIGYLFLGGTAAGGFFAMAAWSLFEGRTSRRRAHSPRYARAFRTLQARTYTICLVLIVFAILLLFWDLGRPERILLIILRPHATVITFGAICLTFEVIAGALLTARALLILPAGERRRVSRAIRANRAARARCVRHAGAAAPTGLNAPITRPQRALELTCCVLSVATMAYTGVFLAGQPAVPFWNTPALVCVFVFSSLSCGVSLMLLVDYFIQDQTLLLRAAKPLQKCHLACLAAEAISLAAFLFVAFDNPAANSACALLLAPDTLSTAVVGIGGFGLLAPAVLETYSLTRKECRSIPVSDALCLLGGICLRSVIIACGVH